MNHSGKTIDIVGFQSYNFFMELEWIDSHVHLQDSSFAGDLDLVILRAQQAGIGTMICNGTSQSDWVAVLELARHYHTIVPFLGLHPWFIKNSTADWLAELEELLKDTPGGLGEIGLDRCIEDFDEKVQETIFCQQLDLAARLNRPVAVHCVQAWGRLVEILHSQRQLPTVMMIHAYGGPVELIEPLAKVGVYFSFAASVLDPRREKARWALQAVPEDRLLLETSSPELIPAEFYRMAGSKVTADGKGRNEPGNLPRFAAAIAELRGWSAGQLAELTTKNAREFLKSSS
jgi:TatD DNase family protein